MNAVTPPRRRWYQFSLRTMFVLVTLLSIPLAWVGYSMSWIRQRHQWINKGIGIASSPSVAPPTAPGGLWLLGEKGIWSIIVSKATHDADELHRLFPEATIYRREGIYHRQVYPPRSDS